MTLPDLAPYRAGMRVLVPLMEFAICLLILKWWIYGYRRKSELSMIAASVLLLFGLIVLASELLIDGFYRDLRAGRINRSRDIRPQPTSIEEENSRP